MCNGLKFTYAVLEVLQLGIFVPLDLVASSGNLICEKTAFLQSAHFVNKVADDERFCGLGALRINPPLILVVNTVHYGASGGQLRWVLLMLHDV